jgi:molecular chaperone HtpG
VSQRPDLIGQFGVGFYSAFMVADRVTVLTRTSGDPASAVRWESEGQGEFTVEPAEKAERGTDVVLHLKEDAKEFLDEWRLRNLVKKFSNFIEHPVALVTSREEDGQKKKAEETVNTRDAIWLRPRSEVKREEYEEFYQQIATDTEGPARVIHYTAEGAQEYRVLLFIPARRPFEFDWGEVKPGPRLYIQRVLIMEHCEQLLPLYLRFVKGVVDSSDLPLNISRELLQENPLLERIRKDLVRTVLKDLRAMQEDEPDRYLAFFKELGAVLKEGVSRDWENRDRVADLMLFESTRTEPGKYLTLAQYVEAMPPDQKEIYYLIGDTRSEIENSPYLELFRSRGQDVLLLTDPIDEFVVSSLRKYKGRELKAVNQGELPVGGEELKEKIERYKGLLDYLKGKLDEVQDVRLSVRLKESAACLVAGEDGVTAHMERLMQRMGRGDLAPSKRVLEMNPDHPAVTAMRELFARNAADGRLEAYARLLYDQAVLAEGSKVKDPAALARRINDLLTRDAQAPQG